MTLKARTRIEPKSACEFLFPCVKQSQDNSLGGEQGEMDTVLESALTHTHAHTGVCEGEACTTRSKLQKKKYITIIFAFFRGPLPHAPSHPPTCTNSQLQWPHKDPHTHKMYKG